MEFIHQPYQPGETIAAVATPPGEGGVAIVRISGKDALEVGDRIFSGPVKTYASHTAHFGRVRDLDGNHVDDALVLVMRDGRSFTGEDTVEIHCHGGSLITRRVLDVVLAAGARAARPGEFTFNAFINGKMDLAQAEAVQELVSAKNEKALDAAEQQLQGRLSTRVAAFQKELTDIAAILEAWVDFPDEGLEFASVEEVCSSLEKISAEIERLVETYHDGKIVHDGIALCLAGSPNVGKSSLMNALLDKDRAIVSDQPGTTRDIVEDQMRLNGLNFRLIDTAGIRTTAEAIEQEGIRRSRAAMEKADLILLVFDGSKPLSEDDRALLKIAPASKTIVVRNKIDLPQADHDGIDLPHTHEISAKERRGIEELHSKIDAVIWEKGPPSREEILVTNVRHKESLVNAAASCRKVISGLKEDVSPEFISSDMREALNALGSIIGTNISEDILSAIFSKFCIGK